jgi:hypothetical protein
MDINIAGQRVTGVRPITASETQHLGWPPDILTSVVVLANGMLIVPAAGGLILLDALTGEWSPLTLA